MSKRIRRKDIPTATLELIDPYNIRLDAAENLIKKSMRMMINATYGDGGEDHDKLLGSRCKHCGERSRPYPKSLYAIKHKQDCPIGLYKRIKHNVKVYRG